MERKGTEGGGGGGGGLPASRQLGTDGLRDGALQVRPAVRAAVQIEHHMPDVRGVPLDMLQVRDIHSPTAAGRSGELLHLGRRRCHPLLLLRVLHVFVHVQPAARALEGSHGSGPAASARGQQPQQHAVRHARGRHLPAVALPHLAARRDAVGIQVDAQRLHGMRVPLAGKHLGGACAGEEWQCVVADAGEEVHHRLARGVQAAHAPALGDVAGGEHAPGGIQAEQHAVFLVRRPAVGAQQQLRLAVPVAAVQASSSVGHSPVAGEAQSKRW
mmetsp:Transcript_13992/g.35247  ORF Transcript_13992/g.35247 Transcript_13992/m.35247 type:complete len:272 (-) Transcript_13992:1263-2078(-)